MINKEFGRPRRGATNRALSAWQGASGRERMRGEGIFTEQIRRIFEVARRKGALPEHGPERSTAAFRRPPGNQMELDLQKPAET